MATWAIGDLQGCYGPTQRLLEKIRFDPARDRLWFCGDLVNRGGESLETLRLVHSLREHCEVVLGNHDLSLLAISERSPDDQRKVNPDLQRILFAEDREPLIEWLRHRPLVHSDRELGWMMIHAGLAPKWSTVHAEKHAREVEHRLRSDSRRKLLRNMYGDYPPWSPALRGVERERAIINIFTRLRYCSPRGRIAFNEKGAPGTQAPGLVHLHPLEHLRQQRGLALETFVDGADRHVRAFGDLFHRQRLVAALRQQGFGRREDALARQRTAALQVGGWRIGRRARGHAGSGGDRGCGPEKVYGGSLFLPRGWAPVSATNGSPCPCS